MSNGSAIDQRYVWHPFTQMKEWTDPDTPPLMIVGGEGAELIDEDGNRYIDGNASIWTNLHGHRVPELDEAIQEQLGKIAHCSSLGMASQPAAELAYGLLKMFYQDSEESDWQHRVFFSDDGSTAMEAALKMVHQARQQRGEANRQTMISLSTGYHGDTVGAMSIGQSPLFHQTYKDLLFPTKEVMRPACYRCPYNQAKPVKGQEARLSRKCHFECVGEMKQAISEAGEAASAVVMEPSVQGAGGMAMMPEGYLREVADLCQQNGLWLILDEVMTGFGRTGAPFACHKEEVIPDLLALGKGMTGGYLPMAATLVHDQIYEAFLGEYEELKTFFHGHSYSGNPLGAAVSNANLRLLQERGFDQAKALEDNLQQHAPLFWELDHVGDVRQEGPILAIELVEDFSSAQSFPFQRRIGHQVCQECRKRGLLTRPILDVLVLMLPYAAGEEQVESAASILRESIEAVLG
ncbi:MAG: adenosylmethionine--8-amino-7-oxononanoate transaminase [Verrucomicrobiota bacterium]